MPSRGASGWARWLPLLSVASVTMLAAGPASARVVLLGIDGGSWNLIDAGIARGELQYLHHYQE